MFQTTDFFKDTCLFSEGCHAGDFIITETARAATGHGYRDFIARNATLVDFCTRYIVWTVAPCQEDQSIHRPAKDIRFNVSAFSWNALPSFHVPVQPIYIIYYVYIYVDDI